MKNVIKTLAKRGIEMLDENRILLKCIACGQVFSPQIRPGGKLPRKWWYCPSGCNWDK